MTKDFIVINGLVTYLIKKENMAKAIEWAENQCDHSKEIVVREYERIIKQRPKKEKMSEEEHDKKWRECMHDIKKMEGSEVVLPHQEMGPILLEHFTNCLPPIFNKKNSVMCSEPYGSDDAGRDIYFGIYLKKDIWYGIVTTPRIFLTLT